MRRSLFNSEGLMKRKPLATLLFPVVLSLGIAGCGLPGWVGPNLNISYIIPLGFGGAPGMFNPYGIVQALVNAFLGAALTNTDETTSTGNDGASPSVNPGAIDSIVN